MRVAAGGRAAAGSFRANTPTRLPGARRRRTAPHIQSSVPINGRIYLGNKEHGCLAGPAPRPGIHFLPQHLGWDGREVTIPNAAAGALAPRTGSPPTKLDVASRCKGGRRVDGIPSRRLPAMGADECEPEQAGCIVGLGRRRHSRPIPSTYARRGSAPQTLESHSLPIKRLRAREPTSQPTHTWTLQ